MSDDDIVARLRGTIPSIYDARDAADEIERLRAELAAERERADRAASESERWIVRDRLKQTEAERDELRTERNEAMDAVRRAVEFWRQAEAERDELRDLLKEAREWLSGKSQPWANLTPVLARIDAALGGSNEAPKDH